VETKRVIYNTPEHKVIFFGELTPVNEVIRLSSYRKFLFTFLQAR